MTPPIIDWHLRFNFGGPRALSQINNIFIHTTENTLGTPAENVATYQINTQSGSYHRLVDSHARILIENTDDWVTWSTGNKGNYIGLHLSFVAYAGMTRQQWLAEMDMLDAGAWQVAQWCREHDIPAEFIGPSGLQAGEPGISDHNSTRIWGGTDHTDPGPNFPWDVFLGIVNDYLNPDQEVTAMPDAKIDRIHHELTHEFQSRHKDETGKQSEFRDTLVGYVLEMDRKIEDIHRNIVGGSSSPSSEQ